MKQTNITVINTKITLTYGRTNFTSTKETHDLKEPY